MTAIKKAVSLSPDEGQAVRDLYHQLCGGVVIGCRTRGGNIIPQVIDSGIGIRENRLADIFKEFIQVHDDYSTGELL